MKKSISIIILIIILLIQIALPTYAEGSCKLTLSTDKQSINKSDVLTVSILMSNITIENGVSAFYSILDFSKDKFELVLDESDDAKKIISEFEGTEYKDCKVLYIGQNDEDEEILNPWVLLCYEQNGAQGIIGITNEPQTESQKIAKIKLKAKDNIISSSNEKIILNELRVMDTENAEVKIDNVETTVRVIGTQQIGISNSINNTNEITNTFSNNTSTYNKITNNSNTNLNNKTVTDKEVPKAGTPIILPIVLILVLFVIIKYKKIKDFKDI